MIVLIIVLILICSAMSDTASAKDWEASEYNAEMRHRELVDAVSAKNTRTVHKENREIARRAISDGNGRTLVEEVIVESLEDLI